MKISLGPIGSVLTDVPPNPQADGFGSNPRCLRRDVNKFAAAQTTANYTYALISNTNNIDKFQEVMLGTPEKDDWGVHMSGELCHSNSYQKLKAVEDNKEQDITLWVETQEG